MFSLLKDKDLIDSYRQAIALSLEKEFIQLLEKALHERGLHQVVRLNK
ncbi:sporulation histidine kinase inhibitor Sda [Pueribacillus theae]|uniref:Sporulation histidine kinase inhibitor Sda n=1 Tax=Pueribacillus theae TaxID=2171751 RepID=A0A2U1K6C2_9BACI|nr:sporulation histidine kinase inhibitor Sda [Pueribacillus theae]PWA13080.1 sporulation histidine kinase inhibitor Sda [Pueribacillus theae]